MPRQIALITALVLVIGVVSVLVMNLVVVCGAQGHIVRSPDKAPRAPVAIVLGAKVLKSRRLSDMLADRVNAGIDLYKKGKVKKLLLTGDHGRTAYDEVNSMRKYALQRGVPAGDIFMDHAGFNTYDSMYRARDVFGVKQAVIVTQDFHLARSVYTARALGIDASGVSADRHIYAGVVRNEAREALARIKAFIQLTITHPRPKFLGPKIPITGDGRLTNDKND
ncbi:SanA/YdcF family protein [Candidatus Aquicultor sp.]